MAKFQRASKYRQAESNKASAHRFWLLRYGPDRGELIGGRALRADAVEAITCGWLSVVAVVGLTAQCLIGAWWIDAVTSLGIVWFIIKEGREAWKGEACCDDCN